MLQGDKAIGPTAEHVDENIARELVRADVR